VLATALALSGCTSNSGAGSASRNDRSTQAVCTKYKMMIGDNSRGGVALLNTAVRFGTRAMDTTLRAESEEIAADLQDPETRRALSALSRAAPFNPNGALDPNIAEDRKTQDLLKRIEGLPNLCKSLLRAPKAG